MVVVVLADADLTKLDLNKTYNIGVEGGSLLLINNHLTPFISIGDFDSVSEEEFNIIKENSKTVIKLNSNKDFTDTHEAILEAKKISDDVVILGGIKGNRIEHLIANINLFKYFDNLSIINEDSIIYTITKDTVILKDDYKYISFFAIEDIKNLTLIGFKYCLNNYNLKTYDSICISNEILDEGNIKISNGKLLVIKTLK